MDIQDKDAVVKEIKTASFFIVAAMSPSFLISLICVALYLLTCFPELKEPVANVIAGLLAKAGVKTSAINSTTKE